MDYHSPPALQVDVGGGLDEVSAHLKGDVPCLITATIQSLKEEIIIIKKKKLFH